MGKGKEIKQNIKVRKRWPAKKWLLLIAVLLVVFAAVPVINELIPQQVKVKYVSFDGEKEVVYNTRAHRVSELTGEHGDSIVSADVVTGFDQQSMNEIQPSEIVKSVKAFAMEQAGSVMTRVGIDNDLAADSEKETVGIPQEESGDAYVTNGMEITVIKAEPGKASIAGKKMDINVYPGTVRENLENNGIEYDEDDVIKPELDEPVEADTKIKLTAVEIKSKDKKLTVEPKEAGAVFDKSLASGTIRRTEGEPGEAVYTYIYKYVNGKKIKTRKKFKKWIKTPVDIKLTFGTSQTGETGKVEYSSTFIGNCTAYYFGNNAHGATGQRCHYGTCAVDPKVIPYGTKLYVEGYGTAVANDCGGAVKGHIIDLYMRSTKECFSWGRRNKKVYVLK